jgi:predicted TIM-barrel fold metal-dependent hydrolase
MAELQAFQAPSQAGAGGAGWDCHVHVFDASAPVQAGHYQPAHQPLERIEVQAHALGANHLVLVQPSVYGTDNRVLLQALARESGRHRGVVVVGADVTDADLHAMHALGVRGVRFNLVSPVGNGPDALRALSPRLRALGWHVQWYAAPQHLAQIAALQTECGLTCVLDHLAGMHALLAPDDSAWHDLERLAKAGAWIKLSGWYRLQAAAPYAALHTAVQRVAGLFGQRMVWGSDWPHTSFAADDLPAYASVWTPVVVALGAQRAQQVLQAGAQLYA